MQTNTSGQAPQGSESDGMHGNVGGQNQAAYQTQSGQALPQSSPQVVQVPLSAATTAPLPSFHAVVTPSSLVLPEIYHI